MSRLLLLLLLLQLLQLGAGQKSTSDNCGVNLLYQSDNGLITSHSLFGRRPYRAQSNCRYVIRSWSPQYHIEVSSVDFSLEYTDSCAADSLTLYNGPNETSPVLGSFCGSRTWSTLSPGPTVMMVLRTDKYLEKDGFRLRYRFVSDGEYKTRSSCPTNFLACRDGSGCYPLKWKCDNIRDCVDGSDEMNCNVQQLNCPTGTKACADNSKCVYSNWWCDGFRDCPDGSDENCGGGGSSTPSPGTTTPPPVTQAPPSGSCGRPSILPDEGRIVGGKPAIAHSWPWMVSLRLYSGHFCGGSIYNDMWIITAAHCVQGYMNPSNWKVDAGRNCRDCTESSLQRRNVVKIVKHQNYDSARTNRDIAMMKVDRPFQFNSKVATVCLPSAAASGGTDCFTTGWGNTQGTGDNSKLLQVAVPIVPSSICGDSSHYGGAITPYMICAGYEQGGKDACQGDSGGPLVCKSGSVWYLQGVTSWGEGCAKPQRPGVYARVHQFISWITNVVANY